MFFMTGAWRAPGSGGETGTAVRIVGVIDHEVARAWQTLESRSPRVDLLRAVRVAARDIREPGDDAYTRFQELVRSVDATVVRAIEGILLAARRRDAHAQPAPPPALHDELRRRLKSPDSMDRLVAVQDCLQRQSFACAPVLAQHLRVETDTMVLVVLTRALGVLGTESEHGAMAAAAHHPTPAVRASAVEGLRQQPGPGPMALLLERLADEDDQVRHLAREGLASSDPDLLVATLRALPPTASAPYLLEALEVLAPWRRDPEVDDLLGRFEAWPDDAVAKRAEGLREVSRPGRGELSSWA